MYQQYDKNGVLHHHNVTVSKEVILSAGVFQSPQLLMLSGIGPRETLKEHGIDVVVDNEAVGQG
jgi:choline dehydrogenase